MQYVEWPVFPPMNGLDKLRVAYMTKPMASFEGGSRRGTADQKGMCRLRSGDQNNATLNITATDVVALATTA